MLTYEEARKFIEETSKFGSVLGLTAMRALMNELGNVQNTIPTIHIAGTNGKGSVGAYIAAICKTLNFKVGRYCSPAVFSPLECWQYDGENITEEEYALCVSQVKNACDILAVRKKEPVCPTVFEIETAMAFVYFSQKKTDLLLLETGLGGETDATNVVDNPLACVFTNISYDHMQFLGNTLEEIAFVKAGIMKPGALCFWGTQKPEVLRVLNRKFEEIKAEGEKAGLVSTKYTVDLESLSLVSEKPGELVFEYDREKYKTSMAGIYQMKNAALAVKVCDVMWQELFHKAYPQMPWPDEECDFFGWDYARRTKMRLLRLGIRKARWQGRFEVLGENPYFIMDGAHNEDAARQLKKTIENCFTNQPLTYIIGVLADKEHKKMLEIMLPQASKAYFITPQNARGMDGRILLKEAEGVCKEQNHSVDMEFCPSIEDAVEKAVSHGAVHKQPILAFGSLSYLGNLKTAYGNISKSAAKEAEL